MISLDCGIGPTTAALAGSSAAPAQAGSVLEQAQGRIEKGDRHRSGLDLEAGQFGRRRSARHQRVIPFQSPLANFQIIADDRRIT